VSYTIPLKFVEQELTTSSRYSTPDPLGVGHAMQVNSDSELMSRRGMNVAAGPELAAAVSNAGGLGVIGGLGYTSVKPLGCAYRLNV
jgi:hypothetical protein